MREIEDRSGLKISPATFSTASLGRKWEIHVSKRSGFKDFLNIRKIRVETSQQRLDEATRRTVGNFTARRDPPHFQGDEYHGHAAIPGGYEVSWGISGARRHPNKFPAVIPADARQAVADVLGVSVSKLECFKIHDDVIDEDVFLVELVDA